MKFEYTEGMTKFEKFSDIRRQAKENPITFYRIDMLIDFVSNYAVNQEQIAEKLAQKGQDPTHCIYERDMALHALGLCNKPNPYWHDKDY